MVHISDTHGMHSKLKMPEGDIAIHSGDFSGRGTKDDAIEFLEWFGLLDYKFKIVIAGNHDLFFEKDPSTAEFLCAKNGIIYLNDSGVTLNGIKFWGSPITPQFNGWAFNRARTVRESVIYSRGRTMSYMLIKPHWDKIPNDTDVLITHGPPDDILDRNAGGEKCGCVELRKAIERVKPDIHLFGHIHEGHGEHHENGTSFYNGSVCDAMYRPINEIRTIILEEEDYE